MKDRPFSISMSVNKELLIGEEKLVPKNCCYFCVGDLRTISYLSYYDIKVFFRVLSIITGIKYTLIFINKKKEHKIAGKISSFQDFKNNLPRENIRKIQAILFLLKYREDIEFYKCFSFKSTAFENYLNRINNLWNKYNSKVYEIKKIRYNSYHLSHLNEFENKSHWFKIATIFETIEKEYPLLKDLKSIDSPVNEINQYYW